MRRITVQLDRKYAPRPANEMAYLFADLQEGRDGGSIHLGETDTRMVIEWFVLGYIDKLKLEMWPGPT